MANSLRSRPAKASYSCHSRSVTWLTAVRLSTLAPLASRKAASMSRVLSPRAYISTASCSSSAVRPARPVRTRETKVSPRSATCGTPYSIAPSAVRTRRRPVLVVAAAHRLGDLGLQRLLDDLPDGELDQFAPRVALSDALGQQLVELLACPLRGRYSRLHGDASSCRRRQPATLSLDAKQECIPVSFSSKSRTSPNRSGTSNLFWPEIGLV